MKHLANIRLETPRRIGPEAQLDVEESSDRVLHVLTGGVLYDDESSESFRQKGGPVEKREGRDPELAGSVDETALAVRLASGLQTVFTEVYVLGRRGGGRQEAGGDQAGPQQAPPHSPARRGERGALQYSSSVIEHDAPAARSMEGGSLARAMREDARLEAARLSAHGIVPHLKVILLGADPASEAYVASKTRAAREAGCRADTVRFPSGAPPEEVLAAVARANQDGQVHGVLVQLPLEAGHDPRRVFDALDPEKDVDGVHPENVGLLQQGRPRFVPCTPAGVLALLDAYAIPIAGRRAVVLGRSEIVGKPLAALLTARDATVTLCHSKTPNLPRVCSEADLLVSAIGRPGFVTSAFVKPGATVVDVGITRLDDLRDAPENLRSSARLRDVIERKGRALVGDVDYDDVSRVAGALTPVPGGVGPLTVAMLLKNTIQAARLSRRGYSAEMDPLTL